MAGKVPIFLFFITSIFFFATLYHLYLRDSISDVSSVVEENYLRLTDPPPPPKITTITISSPPPKITITTISSKKTDNLAIHENISSPITPFQIPPLPGPISSVSILMPDWEVFVIVSPDYTPLISHHDSYICVHETGEISPAIPAGELLYPVRSLFKCEFPRRTRRRLPFKQPILMKSSENKNVTPPSTMTELLRWTFLVYDSLTTDDDIVLFVKGLNNRQGINREPNEFSCIFGYGGNKVIRTNVTSSIQEVFRCNRPDPTVFEGEGISISLEIVLPVPVVVPSVAYYNPPRKLESNEKLERARLCACTMVYNVGKFLKEWILYHSKIGVEKFLLYDNASDDDLYRIVDELVQDGYDVKTYFWVWPKTQEAGFSHSTIYAKDSCSWIMYIDVDEFVYSPLWSNLSLPSESLLHSLLPNPKNIQDPLLDKRQVAEISIPCYEFGPSNMTVHPITGVTQGYNCRRKFENRHKSIVLLDAVDHSLLNMIHHFILKQGYKGKKVSVHDMTVNHYKFQAWPEFKAKFRRRVSAYVVDWTKELNPRSKDRTPGLGFSPVEPKGWPLKFCEVYDNGLKDLTRRWFELKSSPTPLHYRMAWQR
ncbi:glycosyltransferase family 92 protein RCOM_0530710-like [Solanum dulcamara]|uniref:glycosyltransferase family 92 protein RCOM_0530710-like n=1 Tax=Solanum dulcamara TaxID=45834 RepID=UPI002485E03A|nr:glycosyltransferase family 92 protein RCOM_0530710-like [Solanum dulcamara]